MGSYSPISKIAIIGAGPTGTCCAKYLLAEKAFDEIDIYEQRDRVGGIWNLSPTHRSERIPIPQEDPWYGSEHAKHSTNGTEVNGNRSHRVQQDSLEFESPLYDLLEANIPKDCMQYSDFPFPEHCPLYPNHEEVLQYLDRYADDVRHLITFETQIQKVSLIERAQDTGMDKWDVTSRNLKDDTLSSKTYDAIVVASGHYTVPHVVDVKGLSVWRSSYPGSVMHSKAYRSPNSFKGRRVLVIGNSASGTDLAAQIAPLGSKVYLSSKSVSQFWGKPIPGQEDIDEIVEFLSPEEHNRAVKTRSGKVVEDLDFVLFATGYLFSFPFLADLDPPLITNGLRTRDTYQHFLHIEYPTLALPVLNLKIIPFGLAENQAAVMARMWSGRLRIPSKEEMRKWEQKTIEEKGDGKYFHVKKFPEEAAQMNELYKWALSATSVAGLTNDGRGKLGIQWDQKWVWTRSNFIAIKMAYIQKGAERRNIERLEALGFDYESWRKEPHPEMTEIFQQAGCP